jgi:ubiquinone/menaquinone biosynthesis C-methylase UbiE
MGKERDADWYDGMFTIPKVKAKYTKPYTASVYYPMWQEAIKHIKPEDKVIDVGCGPGQLAAMIRDRVNPASYTGIDFSPLAIKLAKEICPAYRNNFICANLFKLGFQKHPYNTVAAFEILEHVNEDLKLLDSLRPVTNKEVKFIGGVPDFKSPSHVRHFTTVEQIYNRYNKFIKKLTIKQFEHRYLLIGKL